jgi:hypothetical protein
VLYAGRRRPLRLGSPGACSSVTRAMARPARSSTRSTGWTDCCGPRIWPAGALSEAVQEAAFRTRSPERDVRSPTTVTRPKLL